MECELTNLSRLVNDALRERGLTLSVAESCTGGGIAAAVTSVPGSSDVFKGGVVAYANEVKRDVLSVSETALRLYGAVSEEIVRQMVNGVASLMKTSCAIATSGVAGPGGGSVDKPVGTVWTAFLLNGVITVYKLTLKDCGRKVNVESAVVETLKIFYRLLCEN